ncbi:MAG: hypothetical protein WCR06_04795 [bacterium]
MKSGYMKQMVTVLVVGAVMELVGLVSQPAQAGTAGYSIDPPVIVSVTGGSGSWTHTGGNGLRVVGITSCATGGTLTASIDMMVGTAGAVVVPIGTSTTIVATNYVNASTQTVSACRSVTVGTADYIWPKQVLTFSTATNIATHKVFVVFERKD